MTESRRWPSYRGPLQGGASSIGRERSRLRQPGAGVLAVMQTFDESAACPVTVDEARGPMGMAKRDHLRTMLRVPRIATRWRQVARPDAPTEEAVDRIYARVSRHAEPDVLADHAELIPGLPGDDRPTAARRD